MRRGFILQSVILTKICNYQVHLLVDSLFPIQMGRIELIAKWPGLSLCASCFQNVSGYQISGSYINNIVQNLIRGFLILNVSSRIFIFVEIKLTFLYNNFDLILMLQILHENNNFHEVPKIFIFRKDQDQLIFWPKQYVKLSPEKEASLMQMLHQIILLFFLFQTGIAINFVCLMSTFFPFL